MTLYHSRGAAIDYRKLNPGDGAFLELSKRFGFKRFDGEMEFFEQGESGNYDDTNLKNWVTTEIGNLDTAIRNWTTSEIEGLDTNLRNWVTTEIEGLDSAIKSWTTSKIENSNTSLRNWTITEIHNFYNLLKAQIDNIATFGIGTIQMGFWTVPPTNCLFCWGQTLNKDDFPQLWEFANNWNNGTHSWGDLFGMDENTVSLPNTQDEFLRSASNNRLLGTKQLDTLQNITGFFRGSRGLFNYGVSGAFSLDENITSHYANSLTIATRNDFGVNFDASRVARTSEETRSRNIAINFAIKVI